MIFQPYLQTHIKMYFQIHVSYIFKAIVIQNYTWKILEHFAIPHPISNTNRNRPKKRRPRWLLRRSRKKVLKIYHRAIGFGYNSASVLYCRDSTFYPYKIIIIKIYFWIRFLSVYQKSFKQMFQTSFEYKINVWICVLELWILKGYFVCS